MGCGPSNQTSVDVSPDDKPHERHQGKEKETVPPQKCEESSINQPKIVTVAETNEASQVFSFKPLKPLGKIPEINKTNPVSPLKQIPEEEERSQTQSGFVAFEIPVDANKDLESIFTKPLPPRLQRLAPLESLPKLTADDLLDKQKRVEEKRQQMMEKKKEFVAKSSRRRSELLKAKEFSETQVPTEEAIQDKLSSAELKRQQSLLDIQAKQRLREERRQRAKERAAEIKAAKLSENTEVEIEKYDDKDSDTDSWLNDENNQKSNKEKDRVTSGDILSSGYSSRDASAEVPRQAPLTSMTITSNFHNRIESGKTESTILHEDRTMEDFFES